MGDATDGDKAGHAGSKVRKQPVRAAAAGAGQQEAAKSLTGKKRGQEVLVDMPKTSYAAGKDYFWADVVANCRAVEAGDLRMRDFDRVDDEGKLIYKVPRKSTV